jgi:hypothetical protein
MDAHFVIFSLVNGFGGFIIENMKPLFDVKCKDVHLEKLSVILLIFLQKAARESSI